MTRVRSAAWLARTRGHSEPSALRILFYHRVSDDRDELAVTPRRFREQMDYLASEGYRVVNIPEAVRLLRGGTIPPRTVGLNFDDGFLDVAENALGVLAERGFRATVFVSTGVTDGRFTFAWCSGRPRLLSWDQIVELDREGTLEFEAHSISHPNLLLVDDDRARAEIAGLEGRARRPAGTAGHRLLVSGRPVRRARTPARRRMPASAPPSRASRASTTRTRIGWRFAAGRSTRATACSTSAPSSEAATTLPCRCAAPIDASATARVTLPRRTSSRR